MSSSRPVAFLAVVAIALLGAGCPAKSTSSGSTGPSPNLGGPTKTQPNKTTKRKPAPVEGIKCTAQPCMFHPGTSEYHECLNAGAGDCFQYGRRCMPQSACVLDGSGVHRKCLEPDAGSCRRFGDPCEPGSCAFDATSRGYRQCATWSGGRCTSYGAPCTPAS